jgi:hypothetical protein
MISGKFTETIEEKEKENAVDTETKNQETSKTNTNLIERRKSLRKSSLSSDDYTKKNIGITDPELLDKLDSLSKSITRQVKNI